MVLRMEEHHVENPTGITFPDHVNKAVAQSLRRLHQNLGHPRREDLARHLRLAGAKSDVIQAAHSLKCATCQRHPNPGTRRPAKIVKNLSFNEEVGVDTIFLYTPNGNKLIGLSILDHASGYHVVRLVEGRKSEELVKAFLDGWASWAGLPERVVADQERGLMKDFTEELEHRHVKVDYIAGQAHWQNGAVERQNGWFRTIWDKTVDHMAITDEEAAWTVAQVCHAKNTLRRSHGYSPCQWVFGKDLAVHDGVLDEDAALLEKEQSVKPDDRRMREQAIRQAAREAFIQSQAEETVKRALLGRPRTMKRMYEQGDWVYVYRKSKNAGGAARIRGGAGEWMGPGTVVGREGDSYWVSRGGRCMLCARDHLTAAESEELGSIFQGEAMKEDLMRLADNMEINIDDDDLFKDATGPPDFPRSKPDEIPVRRYHEKAPPVMRKKRGCEEVGAEEDMVEELEEPSRSRSRSPRTREAFRAHVAYSTSTTTRLSKTEQKQQDKEVKWHEIPEDEKEYYVEAEKKQWAEHLHYGACRPLNRQETEKVYQEVPRERILTSRFAYRDKNKAKRREDSTIPVKAKARLCIGGHRDPDLKAGMLVTKAPTATKLALSTLLFIAGQLQWKIAAGDVEAAFLNGNEARRNLYFSQPARGLPGIEQGTLVEVIKGVFGLSTSPRLWWERLSRDLLQLDIKIKGQSLKLEQHELDACYFLLRDEQGELHGALITHVDDLLIAAPEETLKDLQVQLSSIFPISEWEAGSFDYIGSQISQDEDGIHVAQKSYVNSRLEVVEVPKEISNGETADAVTRSDNQSTIGAFSWLSSQSRPDLQAAVSLAQKRQKNPNFGDVKDTNRAVKMAQLGKDEKLDYKKLAPGWNDLMILVYHDAAWANAPADESDPEMVGPNTGLYSQLGHIVLVCDRKVLTGQTVTPAIVAWKSHSCPRVCRSTFAAETMAALEGWEDGLAFRAMLTGSLHRDGLQEDRARHTMPLLSVSDCKSLYDSVHRVGGPRAPSEKRLLVDLAALRQMVQAESAAWSGTLGNDKMLRWVPTDRQMADILTKVKYDVQGWWRSIRQLSLPFE